MNRNILIKLVVVLLVAVLVHSVFWFFKTGQLEKHLNNFVAENNQNISVGEIKVSGYPFAQRVAIKDLKFSIPHAVFNKYQIIIKNIEATSGIFSSNFVVDVIDRVMAQDAEGNSGNVEFSQNPQIAFSIMDGIISHFSYSDTGYRVFDIDKNVIFSAASSTLNLDSSIDSEDQITSKIMASIQDVEGVDVLDFYRNSSEKKIIDGIKTGEISIGGATAAMISSDPAAANMVAAGASPQEAAKIAATNSAATTASSAATAGGAAPVVANGAIAPAVGGAMASAAGAIANNNATNSNSAAAPAPDSTIDVAAIVAKNEAIKSNLLIDIEYTLTPTKNEQQASVPLDPTQIQEVATQYSRVVKVNNIEFSNLIYKIALNGQVNYFQDDNLPSGFLTIRVENLDKLTDHIKTGFAQIAEQKQIIPDIQATDLSSAQAVQSQGTAYQEFLKKVAVGISDISKELSAKNQLSKDNVAIFDMRREKNLEFVINETPLREVLGKF